MGSRWRCHTTIELKRLMGQAAATSRNNDELFPGENSTIYPHDMEAERLFWTKLLSESTSPLSHLVFDRYLSSSSLSYAVN